MSSKGADPGQPGKPSASALLRGPAPAPGVGRAEEAEPLEFWTDLKQRLSRGWVMAAYRSKWARRLFWGGLFSALLTLLLVGHVVPDRLNIVEGEAAPQDVPAPRDVENRIRTEALRAEAAARVEPVFAVDPQVAAAAEGAIRKSFAEVRRVRQTADWDAARKVKQLGPVLMGMPEVVLTALVNASDEALNRAEQVAVGKARELLSERIEPRNVDAVRARLSEWAPAELENDHLRLFARELVKAEIRPNLVLDERETEARREEARKKVAPVVVKKGVNIVRKGDLVTREHYAMMEQLGLVGRQADNRKVIGVALFAILAVALVGLYLWRYRPDILERDTWILMIGFIGLITLVIALLIKTFSGFLMPLAVGTMLLTILLDARVALVVGMVLSLLTGLAVEGDWPVMLAAAVGAFVGVYSLKRVEARADLIRAGLVVGVAIAVAIVALHLVGAGSILELGLWRNVGYGLVNGLLSAVLAAGSLPILESLFGVLTPIKLLELANPNHPLLKKLLVEAPGTYHHTILVANLCEAGAEAVGADPMLARVGAYYHDIGKAKRPYFFTENQFGTENPHDKLPPHLSALIIASHVKDGVEMAREHRLPEEIIDFIREHHGDMLISYFYHKATQNGTNEYILEQDFRYEGPRPRTKETAILMLADGCEASVRALRQKGPLTQDQIGEQVAKIIHDRLQQGQLDRSDLTLRNLDALQRTFVRVLGSVHHARIEYPPNLGEGQRKETADADSPERRADPGPADPATGRADRAGGGADPAADGAGSGG